MQLKINKNKEMEMIFSWKEIWLLIKKRKLIFDVRMIDFITVELIQLRDTIRPLKNNTQPPKEKDVK